MTRITYSLTFISVQKVASLAAQSPQELSNSDRFAYWITWASHSTNPATPYLAYRIWQDHHLKMVGTVMTASYYDSWTAAFQIECTCCATECTQYDLASHWLWRHVSQQSAADRPCSPRGSVIHFSCYLCRVGMLLAHGLWESEGGVLCALRNITIFIHGA